MIWTEDKIKTLKKLWSTGASTAEIAKKLGISKNSVIGKVHRLELGTRPSPIKKASPVKKAKKTAVKKEKVGIMDLKLNTCRWPIGDPTDEDFHFCGENTVVGKPYCAEHCALAYAGTSKETPVDDE